MNVRNDIRSEAEIVQVSNTPATGISPKSEPKKSQGGLARDSTEVSALANQVALTTNLPEVRLDKVASIQAALQAGTYQVPSSEVASKVISSLLQSEK